jgi:hypothetical protein
MMAYLSFKLWSTPTAAAGLGKLQKAQCGMQHRTLSLSQQRWPTGNKQGEPVLCVHAFVKTKSSSASLQPKYLWKMISLRLSIKYWQKKKINLHAYFSWEEKKRKNKETVTPLKIFCNSLSLMQRLRHSWADRIGKPLSLFLDTHSRRNLITNLITWHALHLSSCIPAFF